jgi:hypothetical protein
MLSDHPPRRREVHRGVERELGDLLLGLLPELRQLDVERDVLVVVGDRQAPDGLSPLLALRTNARGEAALRWVGRAR